MGIIANGLLKKNLNLLLAPAMTEITQVTNNQLYVLNRIDRSIADNLRDIEKSFGEDAGITIDFIVFITRKMKTDLWGFTSFTLNDFCKESGRNKQDLCALHPAFAGKSKTPIPEWHGHKFSTVFDYALFNMLQKNIIFSKAYDYNTDNKVIQLNNFSILKDIKLNVDRVSNAVKIYEIRISDDMLQGFLKRYYTIESNGYGQVGKGRGGDGRKLLYIFLYKTRHILLTQNQFKATFPIDFLAGIAGRDVKENRNRKTSIKRILDTIKEKGKLPFIYRFVPGSQAKKYAEDYYVELDFSEGGNIKELTETRGDNLFYNSLVENLKTAFKQQYSNVVIEGEKDAFQRWLVNPRADLETKANIYCSSYYRAYNQKITISEAKRLIKIGILEE